MYSTRQPLAAVERHARVGGQRLASSTEQCKKKWGFICIVDQQEKNAAVFLFFFFPSQLFV